ncbi:GH92 family glycosyl hydrolase [Draconibacterium sp. IB214405]|uniref:GH92 family glycosyl hydrolase n=1 Tax=Draconibacterium sp. IB214405 TaxID=3097352 RepID=UPI002A12B38D|nr:GH92 family glycosyl hydrolase [Draconibacterium sp. IB214405]MDX8341272.1 GH92 family glycosyl hydrolase [Draconibacterium sp. IB214405]
MKILYLLLLVFLFSCAQHTEKNYISYVNPHIGTGPATTEAAQLHPGDHVSNGQTIPAVTAPFGMTQWTPQVYDHEEKCIAPFYAGSTMLEGFRGSHWLSGSCTQDYGSFTIFPTQLESNFSFQPIQRQTMCLIKTENASPAYSAFLFPAKTIMTEITSTKRCGFFRFSWLDEKEPTIMFDVNSDEGKGYIKIDLEKQEVYGYNPAYRIYNGQDEPAGISGYFVAKFDHEIVKYGTWGDFEYEHGTTERKDQKKIGAYVTFATAGDSPVKLKVGTSFTSIDNARKNLEEEIADWDFEGTKAKMEATWNEYLGRIDVESENEAELTKFYTAMYHALQQPRLMSDVNGDYPAFSKQYEIKNTNDFDYYGDFSNWDIFRAQMPLLSLIAPQEYNDMVKSLVAKAEEGNWLPIFPMWNNYTSAMIGDHSTSILCDAAMKGFDFDLEKAYKYMRKNAYDSPEENEYIDGKGRRALSTYLQLGYIPLEDEVANAFHTNEQVSRTLEYAYDDWCVAQVANKLDKTDDYNDLISRSYNYSNVFDEDQGWVNGKYADGSFYTDFDAEANMYFITEGTPKHYTWFVPQDVDGLIDLMGGKDIFGKKLNDLIADQLYWHGNEPSHHIPFLFNYVDEWDKTQKTVKYILRTEYDLGPGGLSGNDDAGQLSAWYVFGAMGFYPVCPGSNEYQLSSPIFEQVTLNLDENYYPGGKFVLKADGATSSSVFTSVKLNGKESATKIKHEDLQKGGTLKFVK